MSIENTVKFKNIYLSSICLSIYLSACTKPLDLCSPSAERGVTDLGIRVGDENGGDSCDFSQRER